MSSENSLQELSYSITGFFEDNIIWHFSMFFDFCTEEKGRLW